MCRYYLLTVAKADLENVTIIARFMTVVDTMHDCASKLPANIPIDGTEHRLKSGRRRTKEEE